MDWTMGVAQAEFLAGCVLTTLSVARGAHPGRFSFSMLDARLLLLIGSLRDCQLETQLALSMCQIHWL